MKDSKPTDFSALIGIDWADKKHDICELAVGTTDYQYSVIPNTPTGVHGWANDLKKRYPKQRIAVACELTKGPLVYALAQHKHITLFPINPATVAKYREAFTHSGAKDDPSDERIQTEILENHMSKLREIKPESADVRILAQHVVNRRKLVQERVKLSNKIIAILKNYYPQVLDWFKEKDTLIFCHFVARWPSLPEAKKAQKRTLIKFFNEHNARYSDVNERRILEIKEAAALTDDRAVIVPNKMMIEILIPQIEILMGAIDRLDIEIKALYKKQSDSTIFDSFPGAGPQLAPRILVAFGTNRDRYQTAAEVQMYTGVSPVIERSGQKSWTHWRYSCPKFLRQTFVEWAGQSVRFSFWAKAYYEQQMEKGKSHNTAIRSLAFNWIRIAFRCWKTKTPYDESKYLEALKSKGSPLLSYAIGT
ncbi:MAG: IS110 family transposase [Pseudomonadales bacterium]